MVLNILRLSVDCQKKKRLSVYLRDFKIKCYALILFIILSVINSFIFVTRKY